MSDRYSSRYAPRPRSPPIVNLARASLPLTVSGYYETPHHHVVPSGRREVIPNRSSSSAGNGTVMTTYKVTDALPRARDGSRSRRFTVDNHNRPPIIITEPPRRDVIHGSGGGRPASPLSNSYRSSEEDYVAIPASSRHSHHHRKRHSATMDNGEIRGGGLRVAPVREPNYANIRSRPIYPGQLVRHADNVAEDYGENGYGYTNPQDVVRYDLSRTAPPPPVVQTRPRRDSYEARTSRPTSITGYSDLAPRSYETRDRGPPPSTRGFDRIPASGRGQWEPPQIRMPVPPPSSLAPIEPVSRLAPFDPIEPVRRDGSRNSSRARPTSLYHDREPRRGPREEYYEVRDDERARRERHHGERYEDGVEQRGYGLRAERPERGERDKSDRVERADRGDRGERRERGSDEDRSDYRDHKEHKGRRDSDEDRSDYRDHKEHKGRRGSDEDRSDYKDHKDHKGRDLAATGLSLAGAALGIKAVKNARENRDDRDDREERRSDYDDEPRKRRGGDDRDSVDLAGRDPKERRHRDDDLPPRASPPLRDGLTPRDIPPPPGPPPSDKDVKVGSPPQAPLLDLSGRDPRERKPSKDDDTERRERRRRRAEAAETGSADSRSDSSVSPDDTAHPVRRESRLKRSSGGAANAFNPRDTMGLMAMKEALNNKDPVPKSAPKEPIRTTRESLTKDPREVSEVRKELNDPRRSRDILQQNENRQLRVVSPPREKAEEKPVKSILRPPREKFPEDPAPIREGVAPLKDAKKDGIPPDARWTKISRKLVNPEALEAGKERFEAREDFVIVLRVLSRDEVQGYAEVTQKIRGLYHF
jgi:zinc finger CCCH domain-containing protein 13